MKLPAITAEANAAAPRRTVRIQFDPNSIDSYRQFLKVKSLPTYRIHGRQAEFPAEYAKLLALGAADLSTTAYDPLPSLFDYQRDISRLAIHKQKFAIFVRCGLGKTLIMLEFARHVAELLPAGRAILIVSPLMVIPQTIAECKRFYGDSLPIETIPASGLAEWLQGGWMRIGITNYEAIRKGLPQGRLAALILDESATIRSFGGNWSRRLLRLGAGLEWKLALTGTPAPNDRIEYANHAVFLDQFPTANSFLAKFFINRGQTGERWELKKHALRAFYLALSHWSIFLNDPTVYGWKDNCTSIPPVHVHIHDIELTGEQRDWMHKETGMLFANDPGGITSRSKLGSVAKGDYKGKKFATNKFSFIKQLVESWPEESTLIWALYNREQESLEQTFPEAASIAGSTLHPRRVELIDDFKERRRMVMLSKPKILGYGLNLQVATRQVFSGLQDSWEQFHQAVSRSNRVGSTMPLNVHLPITELERPMIETVLAKAHRINEDTKEQEKLFREVNLNF